MMDKVLKSYPAYDIVERECDEDGVLDIINGEPLALAPSYRTHFKAGSVRSYAIECGWDPDEQYEKAKTKGHALYWMIQLAKSITAHKRDRWSLVSIKVGQVIRFEGKLFLIKAAPNDNLKLVELED